ncbi:Uncharacterised protein [Empedobacter falsenii]|uniref:Uncharacterized protein n=2 Tax=Empedobacter falsenii TaxID=343874 RepID=A0A376GL38_9FLAO|nr:Uncharacterised protein [Empedobacter falsenii]
MVSFFVKSIFKFDFTIFNKTIKMNKEKPLSELSLEELNEKRKKVNKLNLSIQIPLLLIAVVLLILKMTNKYDINVTFVILLSCSVTFIPLITGLAKINAEINTRKKRKSID